MQNSKLLCIFVLLIKTKSIMKNLFVLNGETFAFNEIEDLRQILFDKYQITIGKGVEISDYVKLGQGVSIGNDAMIGESVRIDKNTSVGERTIIGCYACISEACTIGNNCILHDETVLPECSVIGDNCEVSFVLSEYPNLPKNTKVEFCRKAAVFGRTELCFLNPEFGYIDGFNFNPKTVQIYHIEEYYSSTKVAPISPSKIKTIYSEIQNFLK